MREAAKKVLYSVARPLRPLAPPLRLVAIGAFFITFKKVLFSSVAHPFNGPAKKERTLFAASLIHIFPSAKNEISIVCHEIRL